MNVTRKLLSELRRPERNVRMHTDKQLKEFRRSIEMFGQIRPIVVDEDGAILAGNGLYETFLSMGRTEADCYVVTGLTEAQAKDAGYDPVTVVCVTDDKAHYFPGADSFITKLIADKATHKLLGIQVLGGGAVDIFGERGVKVILGVQGDAQEAVEAYLRGELVSSGSVCHKHEHAGECGEHQ